ncbi:hypothetical protein [Gorillibacterium sp. CAU 1737]|uniref:hypothetical protein n=1 Tax=Gorillibacterium sp. CAU 1737 TaxID=3140362 RepID=UPI003260B77F
MAKFRKKPVEVDADVFQLGMEDGFISRSSEYVEKFEGPGDYRGMDYPDYHWRDQDYIREAYRAWVENDTDTNFWRPAIKTLEGWLAVSPGDWIITGVKGERYPCKPHIFEETYEPA